MHYKGIGVYFLLVVPESPGDVIIDPPVSHDDDVVHLTFHI